MYLIAVYDVEEARVATMCKLMRTYLRHVQRSVFEGEITQKHYHDLVEKIERLLEPEKDTCVLYELTSVRLVCKRYVGKKDFDSPENFL